MTGRLQPLHLAAECLWSKYGFMDGSPFEFEDRGQDFDDTPPHEDWMLIKDVMNGRQRHDLLETLVRIHLLPAIATATGETPGLMRIMTSHNPVRDARLGHANDTDIPEAWLDIGVEVSREQVLRTARDVIARTA